MGNGSITSTTRTLRLRRIAVVTGTRAEYGLLHSTMEAIDRHRTLKLQVVVAGMHLLRKFGTTVNQVVRDGWCVDARVKMQAGDGHPLDAAEGLARGVAGIGRFLEQGKTDVVVVLGDRIEAMAGALAAVCTGRFVAHIHGGDVAPGDFDDSLRNAITKLAHLHLTATRAARRRVIRMGEQAGRVHFVGAPGLDRLLPLLASYDGPGGGSGRALVVHHPCGRAASRERRVMSWLLRAVDQAALVPTIVYPNSDRGHTGILDAIDAYRRRARSGAVRVVRSLDHETYLQTLIDADVLVGNSSSGIIEAAMAGTPSVNIGPRQQGRQRSGGSVVDAAESLSSIREALRKAMRKRPIRGHSSRYGDGCAGLRIAEALAAMPLTESFRRKASANEPGQGPT